MNKKQEKKLYEFLGQDKLMICTKKQRISNIQSITCHLEPCFTPLKNSNGTPFEFSTKLPVTIVTDAPLERPITNLQGYKNDTHYYHILLDKVEKKLDNDKDILRAKQYKNTEYYYYSTQSSSRLAKKIVQRIDKKVEYLELCQMMIDENINFMMCIHEDTLYVCGTHLFYDGISFAKMASFIFDKDILDFSIIPSFAYYPILTELSIAPKLLSIYNNYPKRGLTYDSSWKTEKKPLCEKKYSYKTDVLLGIKRFLEKKHGGKFGFSATCTVLSAVIILQSTQKNTFTIGLTLAFQNSQRFNNFSAIPITITRPKNWVFSTRESRLKQLVELSFQINEAIQSYGKECALLNYLVTNVYNIKLNGTPTIDCFVSCAPTTKPCQLYGKKVSLEDMCIYGTSMPVYFGYWTCNDVILCKVFSRSKDVNIQDGIYGQSIFIIFYDNTFKIINLV